MFFHLSFSAAERAVNDSMADAKEGLVVSCVDAFETYKTFSSVGHPTGLLISQSLKLMPLYVLAAMRIVSTENNLCRSSSQALIFYFFFLQNGFRPNQRLDDRTFCFSQLKTLPLTYVSRRAREKI